MIRSSDCVAAKVTPFNGIEAMRPGKPLPWRRFEVGHPALQYSYATLATL